MKKLILSVAYLSIVAAGCMKKPDPSPDSSEVIVPCSQSRNWTAQSIDAGLQGSWHLTRASAGYGYDLNLPYTQLYFGDGQVTITQASKLIGQAPYTVQANGMYLSIHTTSDAANYVSGILYLCDGRLLCSNSPADGPDYYYQRD